MTFQRDLALQALEARTRASVTYQFARYALALNYDLLPDRVVHQSKRILLDTLACNIGGWEAPGRPMCEDVAREIGGPEEATVVGSGWRTSAMNATLINSFMTRFPECNDSGGGGHNNESVPSILATAEKYKSSGRDTLTSIVCSYELGARVQECFKGDKLGPRGWGDDTRGCLSMPPSLGRLMGLNEEQIANAIGSTATGNVVVNAVDADREENTMRKNLRMGAVAHAAMLYCMLAKRGFTGPLRVVEGEEGWQEMLANGDMDLEKLCDFSGWRVMKTKTKFLWAGGMLHGHLSCTLSLVKEHNIKVEDVESVSIRVSHHAHKHNAPLAKKYPKNPETADHSTHFLTALVLTERAVGLNSIDARKYSDPKFLDLIERITVEVDPNIGQRSRGGTTEITMKDGRVLTASVATPHGYDDKSLMSDSEIESKFKEIAGAYMKQDRVQQVIDIVWTADKLDNMSSLMKLLTF